MNVADTIENFDLNMVYYLEPIKNTVIDNSSFIRIIYSNKLFILNGIYLIININDIYLENHNNKIKYSFTQERNGSLLNTIKDIEINLLKKANIVNKNMSTKIFDQLNSGFIKMSSCDPGYNLTNKFILKISGVWESYIEYGLTYKIIDIMHDIGIENNLKNDKNNYINLNSVNDVNDFNYPSVE